VEDKADYDFEAPAEGTPINSDAYAIPTNAEHPGTAMVFIDYLLRPENAVKNTNYLYYPFPVRDAVSAFRALAREAPACDVDVTQLENPDVFRLLRTPEVQRRTAAWTEVKAS
jgi:spermidine/putrescine transport system substrate-binding protein